MYKKQLTKEQGFQKLKLYCEWQERSHYEAKEKAFSHGLRKTEVDEILAQLIEENYLNEERFAIQFAGGKFRIKKWGRIKIMYELKQKRISPYCIKKAMSAIEEDAYSKVLTKLAEEKWKSIKGTGVNRFVKMAKTQKYLLQKGYESNLILAAIKKFFETKQ